MVRKNTLNELDEIVAKAADFVKCYKDVQKFTENYVLEDKVLGEGKQFVKFSLTHITN